LVVMTLLKRIQWLITCLLVFSSLSSFSQRSYTNASILASGNWYRMAVTQPGVYRIDLNFLNKSGVNTSNLSSASFRLYGNGGGMLAEDPGNLPADDLVENAVFIEDGGDGTINGNDYILFYATGPHKWNNDPASKGFTHVKNLYSDESYYFFSFGGTGKRVPTLNNTATPNVEITSFDDRYFHELDTVNFLSSGKQWFGEEFSNNPGKSLSLAFSLNFPNLMPGPASVSTNLLARSFNTGSRFSIRLNNQLLRQVDLPAIGNGIYDAFARVQKTNIDFAAPGSGPAITLGFDYAPGSMNSQGWLDWFEVFVRRELSLNGVNQLLFRDWNSVQPGNTGRFRLKSGNAQTGVWDVSNPLSPVAVQTGAGGDGITFTGDCSTLREYVAFNNTGFMIPETATRVENQNLHGTQLTDYIIITSQALLAQANRLAVYHQQRDQLRSIVVTSNQVFNEFSSGIPDPVALRDFVKMFYDRAGGDSTKRPRYLLLFGDGSFDYKKRISGNTNLVPVFESAESLAPLETYTSDDFFGFLDNTDNIFNPGTYLLDIGTGRIPAASEAQARAIVDKIVSYTSPKSYGPWRTDLTFVADDEDNNLHLEDAETISGAVNSISKDFNNDKIYLDAFTQESGPGGSRYPQVNLAIVNRTYNGNLVWNYTGHGGSKRLADEVVLDQDIINSFNNPEKLPLFITATCDFAPHDNPLIASIGEDLLLREKTGAIALMTTTRLVFAFSNRIMNENYLRAALLRKPDGRYPSLGEAVRTAKNTTYSFFTDVINNRKFTLIGDPALTIGYPVNKVSTTAINGVGVGAVPDTLRALSQYNISGEVTNLQGSVLTDFNGTVYPVVYDKAQALSTLANDPTSVKATFTQQKNIIFKGKATVNSGKFSFSFVVPKDINYQFGNGRISYYTENGTNDGSGALDNIIVGGTGSGPDDKEGPGIKPYLNDEKFIDGGISNADPILLLKLADSSGINVMGTGTGHDMVVIIDNDQQKTHVLNEFYTSDKDNFRRGEVRFQLPKMEDGPHTLSIKAWDVVNNSNEATLSFRVRKQESLVLEHVLNYPNPFTTRTTFWFDHNRPGEELQVNINIYTVTGKLVKTLRNTIISPGTRSNEVEWNGRDEYGSKIGRGVYIYRLSVRTSDGQQAHKLEKLYIL
jgi:hypothetical protein